MNNLHSYSFAALSGDYCRAASGIALSVAPLFFSVSITFLGSILSIITIFFSLFLVRTFMKHKTIITINDKHIGKRIFYETLISWEQLREFNLSYFSTWRSSENGWMQLRLKGDGQTIRIESSISGFDQIARKALRVAKGNRVLLSSSTKDNLRFLKL